MAESVEQLIIDLGVRDNASPALKKTREETIKLADNTDKLIGIFKKGDQQYAKVATTLEKIRDRQLRARMAVKLLNKAMTKQVSITDKLGDQMNAARAEFESMGAAGTLLTGGLTALAGAVLAVGAAALKAAQVGVKALIEADEEAQQASAGLENATNDLTVSMAELAIGTDTVVGEMDIWTARILVTSEALDEINNRQLTEHEEKLEAAGLGYDSLNHRMQLHGVVIGGLITAYDELTSAIDDTSGAQAHLQGILDARAAGAIAQAEADRAVGEAEAHEAAVAAEPFTGPLLGRRKKAKRGKRAKAEAALTADGFTGSLEDVAGGIQSDAVTSRLEGINAQTTAMQQQIEASLEVANVTRLSTLAQIEADEATQRLNSSLALQVERAAAVGGAFINMASGLAAGGDSIKEAGRKLLSSFGDIMVQMGTGVVLSSEALLALFSGNPIAGLGAGAALIAGGLLIKGALAAGNKPGGFAGASSSAGSGFAPTFNDFQRDQQKEERQVVQVFIGEQQVAGPVSNIVNDLARRGKLQELAGGSF